MAAAMPRQIGIFGGSFNPPHIGHVLACHYALSVWPLDRVIIVPNFVHAFGKPLENFEHRYRMCMLAFQSEKIEISRIEENLGGVSYTVDTLQAIKKEYPGAVLHLLIGSDVVGETQKWKNYDRVKELAPPLVIPRGPDAPDAVNSGVYLPPVSSTWVREQLSSGLAPGSALPHRVLNYIRDRELYLKPAVY